MKDSSVGIDHHFLVQIDFIEKIIIDYYLYCLRLICPFMNSAARIAVRNLTTTILLTLNTMAIHPGLPALRFQKCSRIIRAVRVATNDISRLADMADPENMACP